MRRFILGIVILMAMPQFAVGQQRDRSGRSAGQTAEPREDAVQPAPARQTGRRPEPSGTPGTTARGEKTDDAASSRARRERHGTPGAADAAPRRWRDEHPRDAAIAPLNPGFRSSLNPGFLSPINPGFRSARNPGVRPIPDRDYSYRRGQGGANVVFVPYVVPMVIERETVVERGVVDEAVAGAPAFVEPPLPARLILDVH